MIIGETIFAEALVRAKRRRMRLPELRALWRAADPLAAAAEDAHERFRRTLDALEKAGIISLPISSAAWDRSVTPYLPRTVAVADASQLAEAPVIAWVPTLSFAAVERHPTTLRNLRAINGWLKQKRGRELPIVPIAERSLEIFGDEKRLDDLRQGETLFGGRLRLADLACEPLATILAWHPGRSDGDAVLVVENAAAYASFRRFNDQAGLWRAVVWGAGNAFRRYHDGLGEVFSATGALRAVYFGDLDPEGVAILAAAIRARSGDLVPHRGLYAALLRRRMVRRLPEVVPLAGREETELVACLPELAEAVLALWREGMVLPQEGYGYQALLEDASPALQV